MHIEEPGGPDAVTVNTDQPVYQVNIFTAVPESVGVPGHAVSYSIAEWKLHDADAAEVLAWAAEKAAGDPYTVSVASASTDGDSHLLRLHGRDPNRGDDTDDGVYTLAPDGMVPDMQWFIDRARAEGQ